ALAERADDASVPRVQVIAPKPGPARRELSLPGALNAWYEAPIYAQVSGYVKMWDKDYGAAVKTGDLLATIDTPTLDAEYAAAKANLAVAQARYKLAAVTAKRWASLSGTQAVSQQEVDVQAANAEAERAQVEAASQNVARYAAQEAFKRVVAPFDGVVTSRQTDIGDYVNAAGGDVGNRGAASELFTVADVHALRVFVHVPQDDAGLIRPGLTATLRLPQDPDHTYEAKFMTTAQAVGPQTRTVTTEFSVDNPDHKLWPGSYVQVMLSVPSDPDILVLPEQALLFRSNGMQVAVLGADDRVHLKNVSLGLNLGKTVQIVGGLGRNDRVINNPSAGLLEGERVKPVTPVAGYNDEAPKIVEQPSEPPARSGSGIVEPAGGPSPEDREPK
ncbi:efflux RND transporter periplasmic adaptor subunit, partial [Endobacter medicaginis]